MLTATLPVKSSRSNVPRPTYFDVDACGSPRPNPRCASHTNLMYDIYICICMSSRNIAVQQAVYDALGREKRAGESFTALFRRILEQREGPSELVGQWGRKGEKADRATLRALRSGGTRTR